MFKNLVLSSKLHNTYTVDRYSGAVAATVPLQQEGSGFNPLGLFCGQLKDSHSEVCLQEEKSSLALPG